MMSFSNGNVCDGFHSPSIYLIFPTSFGCTAHLTTVSGGSAFMRLIIANGRLHGNI